MADEPTNEELKKTIDDLTKKFDDAVKRLEHAEERLKEIPTASELGHEIPFYRFSHDKYFESQIDRGQLVLQLNKDQLQRDMAAGPGGGGGSPYPNCTDYFAEVVNIPGEGTDGAEVNTWEFDAVAPTGAVVYFVTRVFYDDTDTSPVLKAYQRPLTFDATGRLCNIGAEEEYTIDTPEACP